MARTADDEQLMARVRQADEQALEMLVRRYAAPLLSFLTRMVQDAADAEDVFQEVWIAVWVKRGTFNTTMRFRPWVYRIASNRCSSRWRRKRIAIAPAANPGSPAGTAGDEEDGPRLALRREAVGAADAAIRGLPAAQRDVVTLRLFASLGYAEIADVLEVSQSTVRSHMSCALRSLRRRLASWVEDEPCEEVRDDHARA